MTWLPAASDFAGDIDSLFGGILWITAGMFALGLIFLVVALIRFRSSRNPVPARSTGDWRKETAVATVAFVAFAGIAWSSQTLWSRLRYPAQQAEPSLQVEIFAQQYAWNIRYAGADGKFGRSLQSLISDDNPIGLDRNDDASKDDIVLLNEMHLPVDRPVKLLMRSRDVIHSFFVPEFRFKQDSIPGLTTAVTFTPNRAGNYEIACAEYCGLAHYRMRGFITVERPEDFETWMRSQQAWGDR